MMIEETRLVKARAQAAQVRTITEILIPMLLAAIGLPLIGELYLVTFEPSSWAAAAFGWRFDPLDIALMTFAVSVMMIGNVLEAAAASLKAENDQIV